MPQLNTSKQDLSKCSTDIQEVEEMYECAVVSVAAKSAGVGYDAKVTPSRKVQDELVILCGVGIHEVFGKLY